jgi:hypothetical protein
MKAVDYKSQVYVADSSRYTIQKYTATGTYLTRWSIETDWPRPWPQNISCGNDNTIYVYNNGNLYTISIYDEFGTLIKTIGTGVVGNQMNELSDPTWGDIVPATATPELPDGELLIKVNIGNEWKLAAPYYNDGNNWKSVIQSFINTFGSATWESLGDETWDTIGDETWEIQRVSWRKVIE